MKLIKQSIFVLTLLGTISAPAQDLQALKSQILELAASYSGQSDPDGSKAKSFEPLIAELLALSAPKTMQEKAVAAVGAWKQIWGPYSYNNSGAAPSGLDPNNIYQVISKTGFYTNVGIYDFLGLHLIGLLKGQYSVSQEKIGVQFKQSGILLEAVPKPYTLADLPALKEEGKLCLLEFPKFLPPVGIKGVLIEVFDDPDLRITYGEQEGKSAKTLYIMKRVQALSY